MKKTNLTIAAPSQGGMRSRLAAMKYRCMELNGAGKDCHLGQNNGPLIDVFGRSITALDDMEGADEAKRTEANKLRTEMCGLIDKARGGDLAAKTELNALHSTQIDLYVRATSNFTQFFRTVTLKKDEQAVFQNTYRNEVKVRYIGQDGGARNVYAVKAQKQQFIDLRELITDSVIYQIRDINTGTDVAAMAQATVDLSFDMANKVDYDAFTLYTSLLGTFKTTGNKLDRTYVPNSRIITANLPVRNNWDLTVASDPVNSYDYTQFESPGASAGAKLLFRLAACRATMTYCGMWGNIFGKPIRPTGVIMVSSLDSVQLSQEILPTGSTYNSIADGIMQNFRQFDYMGVRWVLVPDVTLPSGTCYPVLSEPVGDMYVKPEFDEEVVETNKLKNEESRAQIKVINFAAPEPWRVNAFSVKYK